jgi:hypothetical protein
MTSFRTAGFGCCCFFSETVHCTCHNSERTLPISDAARYYLKTNSLWCNWDGSSFNLKLINLLQSITSSQRIASNKRVSSKFESCPGTYRNLFKFILPTGPMVLGDKCHLSQRPVCVCPLYRWPPYWCIFVLRLTWTLFDGVGKALTGNNWELHCTKCWRMSIREPKTDRKPSLHVKKHFKYLLWSPNSPQGLFFSSL